MFKLLVVGTSRLFQASSPTTVKTSHVYLHHNKACAEVCLIPMFDNNYGFILTDKITNLSACVDPGDGETIKREVSKSNFNLKYVLCTHKHSDHIGGNVFLKKQFPDLQIIGTKYEKIPEITHPVCDGDDFSIGSLNVKVLYTPCHTKGHVLFYVTGENGCSPILFSGDTLFAGGCGRFFEGTADQMLNNMDLIAKLPSDTLVYCAHEYTENNYKFLSFIDPTNCNAKYEEIKSLRKTLIPTIPTTIQEEMRYNLFMKCRDLSTQRLTNTSNAVDAMATLRNLKNDFR
jgi:hydroxyacylglutathione hydrolase